MAEHEPERRRDGGDSGGFPENRLQDLGARHAERPQDAERLRALQDRERHRAVDQEHADDERQQPERREVRAERGRQLAESAVARSRPRRGWQSAGSAAASARACASVSARSMRSDAAERSEQLLRRRDVGHDRRLGLDVGAGRRHDAEHAHDRARDPDHHRQRRRRSATPSSAASSSGNRTVPGSTIRRSEVRVVPRGAQLRAAQRAFAENRVDAEQRHAQAGSARDADLGLRRRVRPAALPSRSTSSR